MRAIFISYASQDAVTAKGIRDALSAAGLEVWLDTTELRGGDAWDQKIRRQIKDCTLFLPIISSHTQTRTEGYFRLEWHLADQRSHLMARNRAFLLPVCIDDTRDADADVPESFSAVQWTRLPRGEPVAAFVERVKTLLAPNPAALTYGETATPAPTPNYVPQSQLRRDVGHARSRTIRILALLSIAAVVVLGVGYWTFHGRPPLAQSQPSQETLAAPKSTLLGTIREKSIAVLAFTDMSEKKDQDYFSDGLTEELINLLSQMSDLRVPSRTSSFYFKGKTEPIASIAQQLNVAHVLEGSVRKVGNRLRITVQLIRAETGFHLWSQTYDRQDSDIFAVQDDIAKAVVTALQAKLEGGVAAADATRGTSNSEAYNEYLRGRELLKKDTPEDYGHAVKAYQRAIASDAKFAAAYAGLALAEFYVAAFSGDTSGKERARQHVEQAIMLAPNDSRGYVTRAIFRSDWLRDWYGAEADLEQARRLNPSGQVQRSHAAVLRSLGRLSEAIAALKEVTDVDPVSVGAWINLADNQIAIGDYVQAEAAVSRALELDPKSMYGLSSLGTLRLLQGRSQEALDAFRKIDFVGFREIGMAMAEHALGHTTESQQALDDSIAKFSQVGAYQIARVYAWRGDKQDAFEWLERAYRQGDGGLGLIKADPLLKSLRADPRYRALIARMNLPE